MSLLPRLIGLFLVSVVPSNLIAGQIVLSDAPGWRMNATLGAFAPPIIDGDVSLTANPKTRSSHIKEAKEMLDFTMSGQVEAWSGNFGIIADFNHLSYDYPTKVSLFGFKVDGTLETKEQWAGLRGAYRVTKGYLPGDNAVALDLQGGFRSNNLDATFRTDFLGGMSFPATESWTNPMIGARLSWQMGERWSGFAAADRSTGSRSHGDRQWSVPVAVSSQLTEKTQFTLGRRRHKMAVDSMSQGMDIEYDVRKSGPFSG